MKIWTVIVLVLMIAFGLACMFNPQESSMAFGEDRLGVTGVPRIVGGLLVASSTAFLLCTLFRRGSGDTVSESLDYRAFVALALSVLYILGVCYLGFRVSTLAYLLILPPLFDRFRIKTKQALLWLAAYAVGVTMVFHFFFGFFKVYLPPTILF